MSLSDTIPYGRACNHCVKAKAKCTLRDGACDRCLRLKKDCQPAAGVRRKPGRKPVASRTDVLEARLNGIMSLLGTVPGLREELEERESSPGNRETGQTGQSVHHTTDRAPRNPVPHNLSATNTCSFDFRARRITYSPNEVYVKDSSSQNSHHTAFEGTMASNPAPPHTSPDYHSQQQTPDDAPGEPPTDSLASFPGLSNRDAEDALNRFRLHKVKYFPFVHIPDARIAPYRLRQTEPLLWLSIMACATHSPELQDRLCQRLQHEIAEQAIVQHQRSLDLLLGIVGLLGWGMYYVKRDPFVVMYCHIATAIVQDLGLDRDPPAPKTPKTKTVPVNPSGADSHSTVPAVPSENLLSGVRTHGFAIKLLESPVRTMEERRAVLATYLITVLVSLFHRKPIALPWTDHMDECLRVLDAEPETPLDRLLVYQCRLQRIALDVPGPQAYTSISSAREMRLLRDFQVSALAARQRDVEATMPPFDDETDLREICRVANTANEAAIYGVALYTTNLSPQERVRCGPDTERTVLLHKCLRLHQSYFDMTFRKDTLADRDSFVYTFSFHTVTQVSYSLVGMYRLASFGHDDPGCGWDKDWARAQLDVPGMLDTLAQQFSDASTHFATSAPTAMATPPSKAQTDFFSRAARAMDILRTTWMAAWAKESSNPSAGGDCERETLAEHVFSPPIDVPQRAIISDDVIVTGSGMSAFLSDAFTDWQIQY